MKRLPVRKVQLGVHLSRAEDKAHQERGVRDALLKEK
jgi:hypothetical protein